TLSVSRGSSVNVEPARGTYHEGTKEGISRKEPMLAVWRFSCRSRILTFHENHFVASYCGDCSCAFGDSSRAFACWWRGVRNRALAAGVWRLTGRWYRRHNTLR